MTNKSIVTEAKEIAADAAHAGVEGIKAVAGEALGAAAMAATVVVVERTAEALFTAGHQVEAAAPSIGEAARATAARPFLSRPTPRRRVARPSLAKPAKSKRK